MLLVAVALSVLGLLIGPLLVAWTRGMPLALASLDGAMLGIVPALVLLRMLPHLVEELGGVAVLCVGAGYLTFWGIESGMHGRARDVGLSIVVPILALHGFLDGAGLALAFDESGALGCGSLAMGTALVVHKLPEGLFVATMWRSRAVGLRIAALTLATMLGAASGREMLEHTPERVLHFVVTVGLGVLLRMAVHRHEPQHEGPRERLASGAAFVLCLAGLLAVPDPEQLLRQAQQGELSSLGTLTPLLLETAPWLLLALLMGEWRGQRATQGRLERPSTMWLPVVALSLPLLGLQTALLRAVVEPCCAPAAVVRGGCRARALEWAEQALPSARYVLPSYFVGICVAMVTEAAVPSNVFRDLGWAWLWLVIALALASRVGAAGSTVLVAVLVHKGLPLPVAVAGTCLVARSALGAPWSLRSGWPTALAATLAAVLTLWSGVMVPPLHGLAQHEHVWSEWVCATVIAGWASAQLVTLGPRVWLRTQLEGSLKQRLDPPQQNGHIISSIDEVMRGSAPGGPRDPSHPPRP